MITRAEVKARHELEVMHAAVMEHNRLRGTLFRIVDRPDPPDAILSDGTNTIWLEHTDAFYSPEWARDLNSSAVDSETHLPMERRLHIDMDAHVAAVFCDRVLDKVFKTSYEAILKLYGPGILVVGVETPWFDEDTVEAIDHAWVAMGGPDISGTFSHVYLGYRDNSGNHAIAWR